MNFDFSVSFGDLLTIGSLVCGICSYCCEQYRVKCQATLDAFSRLQEEVLDKLVLVNRENAELILENLDNAKCKEAYDGYRVLMARLEHFAIGINSKIYDFDTVDKLAGIHLIYLYRKLEPIIDAVNCRSNGIVCYGEYCNLVKRLKKRHPEIGNNVEV